MQTAGAGMTGFLSRILSPDLPPSLARGRASFGEGQALRIEPYGRPDA
ncbi:hypothetical protein SAMN05216360_103312 [Methylobacterium phyllostachyos]|uniref:Uncharacterized protein n=1 Tax=Methylobacterium phyllostachyos TaxID=582672 RepID=A0A1G9VVF6_9HYPH|nr:hypothetical protein SAMN05216360_103312 [Methylobacterium phyllostachyos]